MSVCTRCATSCTDNKGANATVHTSKSIYVTRINWSVSRKNTRSIQREVNKKHSSSLQIRNYYLAPANTKSPLISSFVIGRVDPTNPAFLSNHASWLLFWKVYLTVCRGAQSPVVICLNWPLVCKRIVFPLKHILFPYQEPIALSLSAGVVRRK